MGSSGWWRDETENCSLLDTGSVGLDRDVVNTVPVQEVVAAIDGGTSAIEPVVGIKRI